MGASTLPATTAGLRTLHERITRYIHGHFRRKLTLEEARDAAADALVEADRARNAGQEIADLDRWLRRAAWRNALDVIRKVEGEGERKRQRPCGLSDHADLLGDDDIDQAALFTAAGKSGDAEALRRAFASLRPQEQRALQLRFFEEREVDDILQVLGCSRHHYENLHKRGMRKLRDALVTQTSAAACDEVRAQLVMSDTTSLAPDLVARRDAHLAGCLACRAFAGRRRGLFAALPLPVAMAGERVWARLQSLVGSAPDPVHRASEAAAGTAAVSAASAGGGATLLSIAGGTKTLAVLCTAGAVTAGVCVKAAEPPQQPQPKRAVAATNQPDPPPPPATHAPTPPTPPTPVTYERTAPPKPTPPTPEERRREKRRQERKAAAASSPFLPESALPAESASTPVATASATSTPQATAAPPRKSSDFAEEFTP